MTSAPTRRGATGRDLSPTHRAGRVNDRNDSYQKTERQNRLAGVSHTARFEMSREQLSRRAAIAGAASVVTTPILTRRAIVRGAAMLSAAAAALPAAAASVTTPAEPDPIF